ncbi:hypothetical protein NPIL_174821 [Nephila pilipes]|uniref:HTH CENPB-type domain-containing protein n=1 Tax=Nephila pilipes TaxID=299642 RepID=A0A8X6URK3_NEPPI|nr:hypothetical protein NPIL_174821 [Nephila pilipes]
MDCCFSGSSRKTLKKASVRSIKRSSGRAHASNIPGVGNILQEKAFKIIASNGMDAFSVSNGWISRLKIRHGDDDNADEERLRIVEDVSDLNFSD